MPLISLPTEILTEIASNLGNIKDFIHLTLTCRTLHSILPSATSPNSTLRLCARASPTLFSLDPHFLIAASARRLARTVLGNAALTEQLVAAMQEGGIDGLYQFTLKHSGLTLPEMRKWHLARFSIINPLSDHIDNMAGALWRQGPDFCCVCADSFGEDSDTDSDRTAYQVIIYGELFGSSVDVFLEPEPDSAAGDGCHAASPKPRRRPYFGPDVRLEFVKYCIPDYECRSYLGVEVKQTGPYAGSGPDEADQTVLQRILYCRQWRSMWRAVLRQVGPDFWDEEAEEPKLEDEEGHVNTRSRQAFVMMSAPQRRHMLWWNAAVQTGGLEGAAAVTTVDGEGKLAPEARARLEELRRKIEALSDEQVTAIGCVEAGVWTKQTISDVPDFGKEVGVCVRSSWPRIAYYCTTCGQWGHEAERHNQEHEEGGQNGDNE